jgi:hypothetical protein
LILVGQLDGLFEIIEEFYGFVQGNLVTLRDGSGVDSLFKQNFASLEQSTCNDDNTSGSVASLDILCFANFDKLFWSK